MSNSQSGQKKVIGEPIVIGGRQLSLSRAIRAGDFLFLTGQIPFKDGEPMTEGDIEEQTRACIENLRTVLEASGRGLGDLLDVTAFLIDMDRDFSGYNSVYGDYFADIQPTRTTLEISALPTPIAVELKVIASAV